MRHDPAGPHAPLAARKLAAARLATDLILDCERAASRRNGKRADPARWTETDWRSYLRAAPAAVNLADLYRESGRDAEGEGVLRSALALSPKDAGLHSVLGLTLIRQKRYTDAVGELKEAAELAPDNAHDAYVYAVALNSTGHGPEAVKLLAGSLEKRPDNRELLTALVQMSAQAGDLPAALSYAGRLAALSPDDQELKRFIEQLRAQVEGR